MKFTLFYADCLEIPGNCTYSHKVEITGKDALLQAVTHDYVCAEYQGNSVATRTLSALIACRLTATMTTATIRKSGSILPMLLTHSLVWPLRFTIAATI